MAGHGPNTLSSCKTLHARQNGFGIKTDSTIQDLLLCQHPLSLNQWYSAVFPWHCGSAFALLPIIQAGTSGERRAAKYGILSSIVAFSCVSTHASHEQHRTYRHKPGQTTSDACKTRNAQTHPSQPQILSIPHLTIPTEANEYIGAPEQAVHR